MPPTSSGSVGCEGKNLTDSRIRACAARSGDTCVFSLASKCAGGGERGTQPRMLPLKSETSCWRPNDQTPNCVLALITSSSSTSVYNDAIANENVCAHAGLAVLLLALVACSLPPHLPFTNPRGAVPASADGAGTRPAARVRVRGQVRVQVRVRVRVRVRVQVRVRVRVRVQVLVRVLVH